MSSKLWVLLTALVFTACAPATERTDSTEDRILEERAREYFDDRFRFYPVEATAAGLHAYDGELGRFGASHMASRVLQLRDLRQRLLGVDLTSLSHAGFVDALSLTSAVKAELFELEELEPWRRSPRFYSDILCRGMSSLFEPWGQPRVEAILSRLDQVPILLQAAVENLESPSPISLEEGLADFERCRATIAELPDTLEGFLNEARAGEIRRATRQALQHIQGFMAHLETNVAPGEPDSFRWGEDKLRVQLLYREMEETPLQAIRLIAERRLSSTKERTKELAATLDPTLSVSQLLAADVRASTARGEADQSVAAAPASQEPVEPSEGLVPATEALLEELRRFVSENDVVAFVTEAPIPPVKTSRFVPARAAAVLGAPGPLDPAGEAVFLLAQPPADLAASVVPYEIQRFAMRDVYPGKYVRFLAGRGQTGHSDLRRLLSSRANREGWAHYAETILLDEGYASADPRLRLATLQQMLVEQTRLVTIILLHAGELSLSTATRMFINEAFLDPLTAEREARMAALDPNRISAALGKLQIMKLRRDFLEAHGGTTTLRDFHEAFLSCGEPPLRLVRLLLLARGEGQTLED